MFPDKLHKKLLNREANQSLRKLGVQNNLIDFSSNDYLGFAKSEAIFSQTHQTLLDHRLKINGATGSRLLSGNSSLYNKLELELSNYHNAEAALLFNSGYTANLGLFSSVPQRGDVILYDEYAHASIRDGIKLSNAKAYKFQHNSFDDLNVLLERIRKDFAEAEIYVVTESVFSMDGDAPNLKTMVDLCKLYKAHLIVDEAHALGVYNGGCVEELNLTQDVFARVVTFGKALGCHGAAVLGSKLLQEYLINFSRPFIYTTAMPPHSLAAILTSYSFLEKNIGIKAREQLHENITYFKQELEQFNIAHKFIESKSAIQSCIIPGNTLVRQVAHLIQKSGFDVKPILSPTVPQGEERLRFCLHSYNTKEEIRNVLALLCNFVKTNQ